MSQRTGVQEMFSNESHWKDNVFMFEKQELKQQIQLSDTDVMAPPSPMKKFGNYVPKIFAGETDFVQREDNDSAVFSAPTFTTTSQGEPASNGFYRPEKPLQVQRKPWVVGDKHVPMVLGMVNTPDIITDAQSRQLNKYNIFTQNDIHDIHKLQRSPRVSTASLASSSVQLRTITEDISENVPDSIAFTEVDSPGYVSTFPDIDTGHSSSFTAYRHSENQKEASQEGVLIPAPDYDEEERIVDFTSDGINYGQEDEKHEHMKAKLPVKMYEGADLSMYLHDDDVEEPEVTLRHQSKARNALTKKVQSESHRPKLDDKYSFFKDNSNNKNNRKHKGNETNGVVNTVRNFSYADSKSVTLGKTHVDNSLSASSKPHDDGERFLQANKHQSSYELFLRSRHGDVSQEQPANGDNQGCVVGDGSDSTFHNKPHTLWKKLTFRFKHSMIKSLPIKEHSSSS